MKIYQTDEVFIAGGMPDLTYVARSARPLENELRAMRRRSHKLIVISGNTKSGKTVLARRIFPHPECVWLEGGTITDEDDLWSSIISNSDAYTGFSRTEGSGDAIDLTATLSAGASVLFAKGDAATGSKFGRTAKKEVSRSRTLTERTAALAWLKENRLPLVIDDFHFLPRPLQSSFVRGVKSLIFDGHPIILIAIPHRRFDTVRVEREMTGRVHHIRVPSWEAAELLEIARGGFPPLNIDASGEVCERLAAQAHGSPHLMQEFCLTLAHERAIFETSRVRERIAEVPTYLFKIVAEGIGRAIFSRIALGPSRQRARKWKGPSGEFLDIYDLTLEGLARIAPGMSAIKYETLRGTIRELTAGQVPRKSQILQAIRSLGNVSTGDDSSVPVLDWDDDEQVLHITDPFFAFHLSWVGHGSGRGDGTHVDPVFTDTQPLGPIALGYDTVAARSIEQVYVDQESPDREDKTAVIIVGRRGAGKTTRLLRHFSVKDGTNVVWISSPDLLSMMSDHIRARQRGILFVEQVSALWEDILSLILVSEFVIRFPSIEPKLLQQAAAFLRKLQSQGLAATPYRLVDAFLNYQDVNPAAEQSEVLAEFSVIREAVSKIISRSGIKFKFLMDSVEQYPIDHYSTNDPTKLALAGLLRFLGGQATDRSFSILCALPAETLPEFMAISSNPIKDFRDARIIHWTSRDLLKLASKRYLHYLRIYEPKLFRERAIHLQGSQRDDVRALLNILLPKTIINSAGGVEDSLPFILRHTQLLPRHLLMILNRILSTTVARYERRNDAPAHVVVESVRDDALVIVNEIINSHKARHPSLEALCDRCLAELPSIFDYGELQVAHRHFGRGVDGSDFGDFLHMMTSIGAVGRVGSTTGLYVQGVFEYLMPRRLMLSHKDLLCVHPLFSKVFQQRHYGDEKPIYPSGIDGEARLY